MSAPFVDARGRRSCSSMTSHQYSPDPVTRPGQTNSVAGIDLSHKCGSARSITDTAPSSNVNHIARLRKPRLAGQRLGHVRARHQSIHPLEVDDLLPEGSFVGHVVIGDHPYSRLGEPEPGRRYDGCPEHRSAKSGETHDA